MVKVFAGDLVMDLFGAVVKYDDDSEQAVSATPDMVKRLVGLNIRLDAQE